MLVSAMKGEGSQFDGLSDAEIELLRLRAARYARQPEGKAEDVIDIVVFVRGRSRYAIPLCAVREVRPLRAFCRIPGSSRCVPGMFHFRGEIISVHDLEAFMDPGAGGRPSPWIVLIEHQGERIALLADEVLDVEQIATEQIKPTPITFGDRAACFQGVIGGAVLLLQPGKLFTTPRFFSAFSAHD